VAADTRETRLRAFADPDPLLLSKSGHHSTHYIKEYAAGV